MALGVPGTHDAAARGDAPDPRAIAMAALLVAVLGIAMFWPSLDHAWLNYDDDIYITDNPNLELGLGPAGVAWAFTTFHGANWFPVTRLSWLLDHELYGLDPTGYHAVNLLLHAANGVLLLLALTRLTGRLAPSTFVAAVFAVHPLHVESVAWAAARKDPLSGLFFMLVLLAYARPPAGAGRPRRLALLAGLLALGLMAKPTLVTVPFVLLLLDFWPLGRLDSRAAAWGAVREKLALFALVAAFCVVVVMAQSSGGTVVALDQLPLGDRIANAPLACVSYLAKTFWPHDLAVIYPHPVSAWSALRVLGASVGLLALSVIALVGARRAPYLAVGWLWFLGTLVPVIGVVQVGSQAMADRYMYLPLIGLSIAIAWGAADLGRHHPKLVAAAGSLAVAMLAAVGSAQLRHWRDSVSLFEHAVAVTEDNHIALAHLGEAALQRGDAAAAAQHYLEAIRIRPDFVEVVNNTAWLLATSDDANVRNPYLALQLAQRSLALTGRSDPVVLDTVAAAHAATGHFRPAVRAARKALALMSRDADPELYAQMEERLALYRQRKSYTEAPPTAGPPAD